jgi:hypothetical protein
MRIIAYLLIVIIAIAMCIVIGGCKSTTLNTKGYNEKVGR